MLTLASRAVLVAATLLASIPLAAAQEERSCPCAQEGQVLAPPRSAQDALKLARHYDDKAATYREEVAAHRRMVTEALEQTVQLPKGGENPAVKKMREHCEVYIDRAKALAVAAERLADFYRLRAEELKEK